MRIFVVHSAWRGRALRREPRPPDARVARGAFWIARRLARPSARSPAVRRDL